MLSITLNEFLAQLNMMTTSLVIIITFSLLAFTFTYNFRAWVARMFALVLTCVMITYTGDIALARVITNDSANRWLHFQWIGIAMLPAAYYLFSLAVLRTTNYRLTTRYFIAVGIVGLSLISALVSVFSQQIVGNLEMVGTLWYLEPGPYFLPFTFTFIVTIVMAMHNVWKAYQRCLTARSRQRMRYLLTGFVAPAMGVFPYLILALNGLSIGAGLGIEVERLPLNLPLNLQTGTTILSISLLGNLVVATLMVVMSYTVVYFGVLLPDRVVRYRLIRFFSRGPLVAILVIWAMQTVPTVERILGLPRDMVLFSLVTGVIVTMQLMLSVSKGIVDSLIYRGDRDEVTWLRELERRLLTTGDLREFLENNVTALCELLRLRSGFVAAVTGPDLLLEAVVGEAVSSSSNSVSSSSSSSPPTLRQQIKDEMEWSTILSTFHQGSPKSLGASPLRYKSFWVWPLRVPDGYGIENQAAQTVINSGTNTRSNPGNNPGNNPGTNLNNNEILGLIGFGVHDDEMSLSPDESVVVDEILLRMGHALADRQLQQGVFIALKQIIPELEQIQQLRGQVPYSSSSPAQSPTEVLLNPSPIHSAEFESWVKDALSHYWGGPKLTDSPLVKMRVVGQVLRESGNQVEMESETEAGTKTGTNAEAIQDPPKALRVILGRAIERLRPEGTQNLSAPEWLLYNILEMRFIQGHKIREIANRLSISESDLYRKQRVAIGQVARVLTEMEQSRESQ